MAGLGGAVSAAPLLKAGRAAGRALRRAHVCRRDVGWAQHSYGLELAGPADVRAPSAAAAMTSRASSRAASALSAVSARIPSRASSATTAVATGVPARTADGAAAMATATVASAGYRSATRANSAPNGRDDENESCSHGA